MYDHYFSNCGRPPVSDDICKGSAIRHPWRTRFLKVFPIQMHREANLTLPCQRSNVNIRPLLAILVDLPSPMTYAKIQPQGHGGHLGQWTATILAIFRSPNRRRLHMKFEQNWLRGFRG